MKHTDKTLTLLKELKNKRDNLKYIGNEIMECRKHSMGYMDFVIIAIVNRSISITVGIEKLIIEHNMTCVRALLRMQLETVLTMAAFWLTENPEKMAKEIIVDGKKITDMKDKDGKRMTYSYLAKKIGKAFEWIPDLYRNTCEYIHFSERHLYDSIYSTNEEKRIAYFIISEKDYNYPEHSWIEVIDYTRHCLFIIEVFLKKYKEIKEITRDKDKENL